MDTDAAKYANGESPVDTTQPDEVNYVKSDLPVDTTAPGAEKYAQIVGVFRDWEKAEEAINALKQAGIGGDTIQLTEHNPVADVASDADTPEEGVDALLLGSGVSDPRRVLVQLRAEGREQEAVAILTSFGSNNSDLPPGTALAEGSIVDVCAAGAAKTPATVGPTDSSFGSAQVQARPTDVAITDSPKPPAP